MFETWSGEGMILSQEAQEGRPKFQCSLCRAGDDRYKGVPSFYRLNQLNEHVKNEHDIIMYSTSVYTKQKDVSSKHLTSGLISRIIDPDSKGRKISRNGKDPADPFLEVRRMELAMDEPTAEPPPLTGEKVLVRPGYPVTSKAVETLEGSRDIHYPCDPVMRNWSVEVSRGNMENLKRRTSVRLIQYSRQWTLPAPKGEKPHFWLTPADVRVHTKGVMQPHAS